MPAVTAPAGVLHGLGLTEADLLAIRDKALGKLTADGGQVISQLAAGQKTMAKILAMDPAQLLVEVRYALQKLDPTTYGRRIRKTYAFLRRCGG